MFGIHDPVAAAFERKIAELESLKEGIPQPDGSDVPWNMALSAAQNILRGDEPRLYIFSYSEEEYDAKGCTND